MNSTSKRFESVPVVDPRHVIEAHQKIAGDHEKYGSPDITVSIVSLFSGKLESKEILDITHRLFALANFLDTGQADQWLRKDTGNDYILVNEALLRAAARAPLMEAEYIKDMSFDKEVFMSIVLEEAESEGKA